MGIRTAILGYGRSGGNMHAKAIEQNNAFDIIAICDVDQEQREKASEHFKCSVYKNYHQMLKEEQLDLVCIVTRSDQHCVMTCDCLESGVNVLVTKPFAVNVAEAERMISVAKNKGKSLFPWLPARWGCILQRLQELLAEKCIGNIFMIRHVVSSFSTRCDWQTKYCYGGGYLLNWGPHIIDPPVVLMNSSVKSVYGKMKQIINPGDVEDNFLAVMTLENDVIIQAEYTITLENIPRWFIQGDQGTIIVRDNNLKIYRNTPKQQDDPTKYASMEQEGEEFEEIIEGAIYGDEVQIYAEVAKTINEGRAFPVSLNDVLKLTHVLDAVRTAHVENRIVKI